MARVGVVIAAFDSADTIAAALDSLLRQEFVDWEALVVDDHSSDGTVERVRDFDDPRIRLVVNETNVGSGASRNRALASLDTELIAVLDADDICAPTRLGAQVAAFDADPQLTVLGAQIADFGAWGGPEVSYRWPTSDAEIRAQLRTRMSIAHCVAMYRRDAVMDVGGYDERLRRAQDFALMLRLGDVKFAALPTVELLYRTVRPLPLGYVVRSGRGAYLARSWNQPGTAQRPLSRGRTLAVDLRSTVTWARRRVRESLSRSRAGGGLQQTAGGVPE
jgi:glycosyltransferase involved in cell wall biosynthesis